MEEAAEINLDDTDALIGELADLQEVIDALCLAMGKTKADLAAAQTKKAAKSGGFDERIYINIVAVPEGNAWLPYLEKNPERYPEFDIHKAAGIIIKDRQSLVEKSKHKDVFIAPGGKLEAGESAPEALVRELQEELQIEVSQADLEPFGVFYAHAAGDHNKGKRVRMEVFVVKQFKGDITPGAEVEQLRWLSSRLSRDLPVGSIFLHEVLPRLQAQGLID